MSVTSSSYFCTIRPAEGLCVVKFQEDLVLYLNKKCKCFVVAREKESFQSHLHMVFILNEPARRDNVRRALQNLVSKYYLKCQLKLKVSLTEGSLFYTIKDQDIIAEHRIEDIIGFINHDFPRSMHVVNENKKWKDMKILYSYDNKSTWVPFFKKFYEDNNKFPTIDEFDIYIYSKGGLSAPSFFKLKHFYNGYVEENRTKKTVTPLREEYFSKEKKHKVQESKDEPVSKKRRFTSESSSDGD